MDRLLPRQSISRWVGPLVSYSFVDTSDGWLSVLQQFLGWVCRSLTQLVRQFDP